MTEIKQNYTIKNCPAFNKYTRQCRGSYDNNIRYQYCSGNSEENCPLKRIVEICKKNKYVGYGAIEFENPLYSEIMQMLEIEEVNE